MSKASKAVTLVLIGSAASLIGYNALSHHGPPADGTDASGFGDFGPDGDGPDTQPTTGPAGSRVYHSSGTHSTGYYPYGSSSSRYRTSSSGWSSSGSSSGGSSSGSSGGGSSHSSSTSRGGFGSTGHSVSSSSS
jgi:hypothetical protein